MTLPLITVRSGLFSSDSLLHSIAYIRTSTLVSVLSQGRNPANSSAVPSTHPAKSFSGGFFYPAIQTEVGPFTSPITTVFLAAFMEAASLSPNNTSIIPFSFWKSQFHILNISLQT